MRTLFFIAVFVLFISIFGMKADKREPTDEEKKKAFEDIAEKYGRDFARQIERLFRLETAHFKSRQFKKSYSPGMEPTSEKFPFGWSSLRDFWEKNPQFRPDGIIQENENPGATGTGKGLKKFISFPTFDAAVNSVAYLLNKRGNIATWYSLKEDMQQLYLKTLSTIKARFI